jgi:hypothetical protein
MRLLELGYAALVVLTVERALPEPIMNDIVQQLVRAWLVFFAADSFILTS